MKKKILLIASLTVMLICLFAVSVSADSVHNESTVDYSEKVTLNTGEVCELFDSEGNALIWFRDIYGKNLLSIRADDTDSTDGNWVEYLLPKSTYPALANIKIYIDGTTVPINDIVVFNIMDDDIQTDMDINTDGIQPITAFVETFNVDNKKAMKLEYVYLRHDTTAIGAKAFTKCTKLKYVNFEDLTCLETIGTVDAYNYGGTFLGCTSLFNNQIMDLSKTKLTSLTYGNGYYGGNFEGVLMSELKLPLTLTSIATRDFKDCTNLDTVFLVNGISTIDEDAFGGCTALKQIYFVGTEEEMNESVVKNLFTEATANSYSDYVNLADKNGSYLIYDSFCAYNGGIHGKITATNACVGFCQDCKMTIINHNESAVLNISIEYIGLDVAGTKTIACTNEGCTHSTTEEAPVLFTCLGYSAPENGAGGIAIGFTVNNTAIKEYEAITGTTVKYGVFAVLKDRLGANDIFAEDGALAEGAIEAEISNHQFALFELKIVGFEDDQKDIKLAMGAYVALTDGETTEYSYMQGGTPNEGEKYYFVSYNDIVKPSTDTDTPATDTGVTE